MQYLITGANGYLGKYLQQELQRRGIPYIAAGRSEFDLSCLDEVLDFFSKHEITHVIHLAGAVGSNQGDALYKANIAGLYNILYVCKKHYVKHFSFASGNVLYGNNAATCYTENDVLEPNPLDWYAVSKYVGEVMVENFCQQHKMQCALVRIGDIYGPNQKTGNLMKAIVSSVAHEQPLKLYGDGVRTRDYIYITDAACGLADIAEKEYNGAINLATGIGTSVKQLVETACSISNNVCSIEHVAVDKEDTSQIVLDITTLRKLGFQPTVSLHEGLKKCVEEFRKNE